MHSIVKRFLLVSLCILSCSCATARLANQGNVKTPIEMKTYRIDLADERSWKEWEASTKPENDTLVLRKLRKWPLTGELQGATNMMIVRNTVASQGWNLTEAEHADNIRAIEEKIMREKGPVGGNYEIQELANGDLIRTGRKLYYMTWTASQRPEGLPNNKRMIYSKGAMYVYFPEGFKDTHTYYQFVITDSLLPPTFLTVNVEQIYPLIDGFTQK